MASDYQDAVNSMNLWINRTYKKDISTLTGMIKETNQTVTDAIDTFSQTAKNVTRLSENVTKTVDLLERESAHSLRMEKKILDLENIIYKLLEMKGLTVEDLGIELQYRPPEKNKDKDKENENIHR